jgi:hypothetical protein
MAGTGCGAELHMRRCKAAVSQHGRLWGDEDRPASLSITDRSALESDSSASGDSDDPDEGGACPMCISCMQPAALCACLAPGASANAAAQR